MEHTTDTRTNGTAGTNDSDGTNETGRFGIDSDPLGRGRTLRRGQGRIAGVSTGLADYLDVDVSLVRIFWVAAGLTAGPVALLGYAAAGVIMADPVTDDTDDVIADDDRDDDARGDEGRDDEITSIAVAS